VSESVTVLGTYHELQGSKGRPGNIDDPLYAELIVHLIQNQAIDFVFEEATGLGPTIAERLSVERIGPNRYLDVDPPTQKRQIFGIPAETNEPFMLGNPMSNPPNIAFANWQPARMHAARENLWLQRVKRQDFKKALMVCGIAHMLSFAFRLADASFEVKAVDYLPRHKFSGLL